MLKYAKHLGGEIVLLDAVVVEQASLGAPADVESGKDILFAPLHNFAEFLPVIHLFKGKVFHRGAGDDKAIELCMAHLLKSLVKSIKMCFGSVFGFMGFWAQQNHFHL